MGKLADELSERARRLIFSRGEQTPTIDRGLRHLQFKDYKVQVRFYETNSNNPGITLNDHLMVWVECGVQFGGPIYHEKNGVCQTNTLHFINEIADAVKHLRSIMILEDLADGREPAPESILRDLDE